MTDEGSSIVSKYIPEYSVAYPMVQGLGMDDWGVTGYPTFFFVSPDGEILKQGIPSKGEIEEALKDVRLAPEMPDTRTFSKIRKAWERKQLGKAWNEVNDELENERVEADERAVLEKLKAYLETTRERVRERIDSAADGPDYYEISMKLEKIEDEWKGTDLEERAEEMGKKLKKDDAINAELKAGKFLAQLNAKFRDHVGGSAGKRRRASAQYQAFLAKYPDSHYAEAARAMLQKLSK